MAEAVESLFTLASLTTLQGSALAAVIVPNSLGALIPKITPTQRNWAGFAVAQSCAYATAVAADGAGPGRWLIALLNGFLIFASAFGLTALGAGSAASQRPDIMRGGEPQRIRGRFFEPWRLRASPPR